MKKAESLADKIADKIREGEYSKTNMLPTVRHLAEQWETSLVTMSEVLKILRAKDLIAIPPGKKGYILVNGVKPVRVAPVIPKHRLRHLQIAEDIKQEILKSEITTTVALPSLKDYQNRFSCTFSTVKEAFVHLEQQGMVQRLGRGYVPKVPEKVQSRQSTIYIAGNPESFQHFHQHVYSLIYAIEYNIRKLNWKQLEMFVSKTPQRDPMVPPDERVAAYFHVAGYHSQHWFEFFDTKPNVPLIIFDATEQIYRNHTSHKFVRVLTADNFTAGQEVAKHTLSLGHNHAAFLSHLPIENGWKKKRMDGIKSIYESQDSQADLSLQVEILELKDNAVRPHPSNQVEKINEVSKFLSDSKAILPQMVRNETHQIYKILESWGLAQEMKPIFDRLFEHIEITVWICINDDLAAIAASYIENRKFERRPKISLVGFDNSRFSYILGLTSYDFGFREMGHLSIQCLLRPSELKATRQGVIYVPGQILPRSSTFKVR